MMPHPTPVFVNGTEGYGCYRIPAIVRATNGDLIAFAEGRMETCDDATDTIHGVCKRSSDNGQTWAPLQVIAKNSKRGRISVVHNLSPIVDTVHRTDRIIVLYDKAEYSEWNIADGLGMARLFVLFSEDHGTTWHSETDITMQIHRPYVPDYTHVYPDAAPPENWHHEWRKQRPTLGHGLQLRNGRLVFVESITQGDLGNLKSQNCIIWSDDLGNSWRIGGVMPRLGMGEATAVELENGSIMVNTRAYHNNQPLGRRAITIGTFTPDGLMAFQATYADEALVCPAVQAPLLRYSTRDEAELGGKSRILFANPAHPDTRCNMTVRLSYDEGQTWAVSKVVDNGPAAYSDLVIQQDMQIGLLYERGNDGGIWYTNFTLAWLTDGQDSVQ